MRTGATSKQIEVAAEVASHYAKGIDWTDDRDAEGWIEDVTEDVCKALVPEDARIIALDDLKKLRSLWVSDLKTPFLMPETVSFLQRIDALIAGDAS